MPPLTSETNPMLINEPRHADYVEELRRASYTDRQIEAELAYLERVKRENEFVRSSRDWNYGIHHEEA